MESIDYWRFHEEFTVIQAVLLIVGADPTIRQNYVLTDSDAYRPTGFDAVFSQIKNAILNGKLSSKIRYAAQEYGWVEPPDESTKLNVLAKLKVVNNAYCDDEIDTITVIYRMEPDWSNTTIGVDDLKLWLISRNFKPSFFFGDNGSNPDYLDPNHPRYAPKLAASIKAWLAMEDENLMRGKTPLTAMEQFLESRYKELGLSHDKDNDKNKTKAGDINKTAVSEAAKVANWKTDGGAPKTPCA